ncbi:MAG: bacterioferritin [Thermoleophilaceae bacterium]|jgi:ferritin|nr:bacterioferritin [Thermoleophilaceae bacterium]
MGRAALIASGAMPTDRFVAALNEQIANEFAAAQQYIAIAVDYEAQTLPRLAAFFYAQALEERNHAMMMVRYLLDVDARVEIPGVEAPQLEFVDALAPVSLALEQERRVGDEIFNLMKIAREDDDYASEQFVLWFVKEQVEEVASMSSLHDVVERSREQPQLAEDYLARESVGDGGTDPTAPAVAGGAL